MNIKNCNAYELIKKEHIEEVDSECYLLMHKKTKARIVLLENKDENKVCSVAFRTPPKDSTGVAHIVEHTVLCGSKKYPVKDPFIELTKSSVNTFLNAMTYPDKTVYPVASCNDKDFQNIMSVYLDAVFYPNIYKEEKIFRQEGWHYELEDVDGELSYNGVVFNEMKGVFSDPEEVTNRMVAGTLFPDTIYYHESGGDPEVIPELTYEEFLDFHRTYYHPSNSYIYFYGDMDMEEKLTWLDEEYLSKFDYLKVESEIKRQTPFHKMVEKQAFYGVTEDDESEEGAYITYSVGCPDADDQATHIAMRLLNFALVSNQGTPIRQALLDAGLGTDSSGFYEDGMGEKYYSLSVRNTRGEKKDEFLSIIKSVLKEQVEKGIDKDSLLAGLNNLEFQSREGDFGSYPKGLMYGLKILDTWIYDDDKPFDALKYDEAYKFLRSQIGTGYFEKLVEKYLLENEFASLVVVEPKKGLISEMEKAEKEKLANYMQTLSMEEKVKLVEETKALRVFQEEETPEEELACVPHLTIEDLTKNVKKCVMEEKEIYGIPTLHHDIFTNGINYIRFAFDVTDLVPKYSPEIAILADLIGSMDSENYSKLALANEIYTHAGSFSVSPLHYTFMENAGYVCKLEVATKILFQECETVCKLIEEAVYRTKLDNERQLKELVAETYAIRKSSIASSGHNYAMIRVLANQNESMLSSDYMKGVAFYEFIKDLNENFDEKKDALIANLKALIREIFTKKRLMLDLTVSNDGYESFKKDAKAFLDHIPESNDGELPEPMIEVKAPVNTEGIKTAGKVQYVARAGNFLGSGLPYSASLQVVKTILSYEYLWKEIRVKGGAYDSITTINSKGCVAVCSYRDPHLKQTKDAIEGIPEYLENFEATKEDMTKYIIGTIGSYDAPKTPRMQGLFAYQMYLTKNSDENRQRDRNQIFSTTVEDIRSMAKQVEKALEQGSMCVVGSEDKVEEHKDLFESVTVLS